MKRTLCAALFSLMAASSIFALEKPFFSGAVGLLTTIANKTDSDSFDPGCGAESYFAGQLDFSGRLFLRGEFYVLADDIFNARIFKSGSTETNAQFRMEELSATYVFNGDKSSHYVSAFTGCYEQIGSDIFLQRQFGIKPIQSNLTNSYHGVQGASLFPDYTMGLSYTGRFSGDNALGLTASKGKLAVTTGNDGDSLNFDARFAKLFNKATIDMVAGVAVPLKKDGDNGKNPQLHMGFSGLFGFKKSYMLYSQLGINRFVLKRSADDSSVRFDDIYFLVEPRIPFGSLYLNIAAFSIPLDSAAEMVYLKPMVRKNPTSQSITGININFVQENCRINTTKFTFGIHGTVGFAGLTMDDVIDDLRDSDKMILITPYTNVEISGGKLNASVSLAVDDLADDAKNAVSLNLGFRTSF